MTSPNYPWDDIHHISYFLPQVTTTSGLSNQYTIETKYFILLGQINWFLNSILATDAFEEGNMANIPPTIKIEISYTPCIMENINVGASFSPTELA